MTFVEWRNVTEEQVTHYIDMIDDTMLLMAESDKDAINFCKSYRDKFDDHTDETYCLFRVNDHEETVLCEF